MSPSSSVRSAFSARSLRSPTRNSSSPRPILRLSPLGSSIENGVENPLKRLTKRSSAAVVDDILAPRILLVPADDSRSPARRRGRSRAFPRLCPGSLGKLKDRMHASHFYPCPAWRLLSLGVAAIIRATIIRGVAYERVCVLEVCRRGNSGRLSQPRRRRRGKGALRRRTRRNSGKARQHHSHLAA